MSVDLGASVSGSPSWKQSSTDTEGQLCMTYNNPKMKGIRSEMQRP